MDLDLSTDFAVFDNQSSVDITPRGGSLQAVSAIQRWVSTREAEQSNGVYTKADAVFHLSGVGLNANPLPGDLLESGGGAVSWVVLGARNEQLTNTWEIVCRDLSIQLSSTVTIQKATWAKDENGIQEATWANEWADVAASFQEMSTEDTEDNKKRELKPRFEVRLLADVALDKNRRLIHGGETYRIKAVSHRDDISHLIALELEEW